VPCLAAHWAENLDSPSVALSINFDLRSIGSLGRIYRLNGKLRQHGLHPVPPGVSERRDRLKVGALESLDLARTMADTITTRISALTSRSH
jgi:hypothetical protein